MTDMEYGGGIVQSQILPEIATNVRRTLSSFLSKVLTSPSTDYKNKYKVLLDTAPDPIVVARTDTGEIVEVNDKAAELLHYSTEELLGNSITTLHPSGEENRYLNLFQTHIAAADDGGGAVFGEMPDGGQVYVETKDDERIPVEINAQMFENGDRELITGIFRDVSNRNELTRDVKTFRRAVEEFGQTSDYLDPEVDVDPVLIEEAGHAIYFTDIDGQIIYANPAFEETTGYDREEVVGKNPRILKSGEMDDEFYAKLWDTITAGETFEAVLVNEDADGEQYTVKQTISPIEDENGNLTRFIAVNSDISGILQRQETLETERDRVEELQQRLTVVNRIIRHNLRSAAQVINGNIEVLRGNDSVDDPAVELIEEKGDQLVKLSEKAKLIEETLQTSDQGLVELDLSQIVTDMSNWAERRWDHVSVESSVQQDWPVLAHSNLNEAIKNTIENAVVHNDSGSHEIKIDIQEVIEEGDSWVELTIADTGPGIPETELETLDQGEEHPMLHTSGLGLWIIYWVIEQSEGRLTFEDRNPTGTVVRMRLQSTE